MKWERTFVDIILNQNDQHWIYANSKIRKGVGGHYPELKYSVSKFYANQEIINEISGYYAESEYSALS